MIHDSCDFHKHHQNIQMLETIVALPIESFLKSVPDSKDTEDWFKESSLNFANLMDSGREYTVKGLPGMLWIDSVTERWSCQS